MERTKPPRKTPPSKARTATGQPPRKRRGGEARGIAELMPAVGEAAFRRFGFIQSSVVSRWHEIVGERFAGMARPESISFPRGRKDGGTLNLAVASAQAVLISHAEPEIIARVNRFFGYAAVARVRYRHAGPFPAGPAAQARPAATAAASRAAQTPVPTSLGNSLKTIADPELKAVLEALARSVAEEETEAPAVAGDAPNWPAKGNLRPITINTSSPKK